MDNTETDIGDIGHIKHKTKTNKTKQKRNKKKQKTKNKKQKTKNKKTKQKQSHNNLPTHNTTLKRCATRTPQQTRDEPRCLRTFTASYKTPSVLLI
jgi:hypothetical protein